MKRTPLRKHSKRTIPKLKRKADILFSTFIRKRDKQCVRCGTKMGQLQCSHFWSRTYNATRYDEKNCDCLCANCHFGGKDAWERDKQGDYRRFKLSQLGEKEYKDLEWRARSIHQFTELELLGVIKKYKV